MAAVSPSFETNTCPQCGSSLPPGGVAGHCPRCLGRAVFLEEESEVPLAEEGEAWAVLGDCELLEEIGRGGMGVVYKARQRRLGREVAVKVLRGGEFAGVEARGRFKAEAENAARLRHPGIVAVYDFGEEQGVCWISMELIAGRNLDDVTRAQPMAATDAAQCLRLIAAAVQHAHEQGVLHRDLKPSNILLSADGQPHIADFGIARRMEGTESFTRTGQVLGSPGFTAPEQALRGAADARTDVYGLGAILYSVLTSRPPFQGPTAESVLLQLRESDPLPPRQLNPAVPRDLETIVLKCLAREPARRYASAAAVTDDLTAFLEGRPISARAISSLERGWRWCRRRPALAAALTFAGLALTGGTAVSLWQAVLATRAGDDARTAADAEKAARESTADSLYASTVLVAQNELLQERARFGNLLAKQRPAPGARDRRGWEWYYLAGFADGSDAAVQAHAGPAWGAAYSPDGKWFASCGDDGFCCVREAVTRKLRHRLGPRGVSLDALDWNPDSRRLAVAGRDGIVEILDAVEGLVLSRLTPFAGPVSVVRWHPDGERLAAGGQFQETSIREVRTDIEVETVPFRYRTSRLFDWSSDGVLAAGAPGSLNTMVSLLKLPSRQPISDGRVDDGPASLRWHPQRPLVAIGTVAAQVRVCDPADDWRNLFSVTTRQGAVHAMTFDPTGKYLATGGLDGSVKVWDWDQKKRTGLCFGHSSEVLALSWSRDGVLASAAASGAVRFWTPRALPAALEATTPGRARWLQWSADGTSISAGCLTPLGRSDSWVEQRWWQTFARWKVADTLTAEVPLLLGAAQWGRWNPDGTRLVFSDAGATVAMRAADGSEVFSHEHTPFVNDFLWSPQGDRYAVISMSHAPRGMVICNAADGAKLAAIPGSPALDSAWDQHQPCAWSRDGHWLAIAPEPGVWDERSGEPRPVLKAGPAPVLWDTHTAQPHTWPAGIPDISGDAVCVAWSTDGTRLAFGMKNGTLDVREALTGRRIFQRLVHSDWVRCVHWHPDGQRLATAGRDGAVKVLDAATGDALLLFADHGSDARAVAWSPDGRRLASAGNDQRLLIRDASRAEIRERSPEK